MKTFSTAGPVKPDKHYSIPPLSRWNIDEIYRLIEGERYFVLHAPRQTGKTSCLLALMEQLNAEADYTALYTNLEPAQAARGNLETGMRIALDALVASADEYLADRLLPEIAREIIATHAAGSLLREGLRRWCRGLEKPLVLLLDEVDSLVGDTLISLLRQIRAGYPDRPQAFPQTVLLCGVRGAGCGMSGTTVSMMVITKSSPAAAPSTSNPNHCAWGTSAMRMLPSSTPSTPRRPDRSSKPG